MSHPIRNLAMVVSTIALMSGSALAYDYSSSTLYDRMDGSIVYVTGGIGEGEVNELEAAKSEYNFHLTNTDKSGAYVSDTAVVIQDRKGNDVMAANAGPLMYVQLPAGKYTLMAENTGVVQTKRFTVSAKKPTNLHLQWTVAE
ncbi:MAG: hypothetical protein ACOYNL_09215 [Rickettsiales bacterium]